MTEQTAEPGSIEIAQQLRRVRSVAGQLAKAAAQRAVKISAAAATQRLRLAAPALAGVGLISAAAGLRFGVWAGLGIAGLFCLRFDARH